MGFMKLKRKRGDEEALQPPKVPPKWVQDLVQKHHGGYLRFVMEKTITRTDLDKQQCRLLLQTGFVESNILPMLDECEKNAANLLNPLKKIKKTTEEGKKKEGGNHEGLPVAVYDRAGWRFFPTLIHWESTSSTVLRGSEWMLFSACNGFRVEDRVEMWAFRHGQGRRLCYVLAKKTND